MYMYNPSKNNAQLTCTGHIPILQHKYEELEKAQKISKANERGIEANQKGIHGHDPWVNLSPDIKLLFAACDD